MNGKPEGEGFCSHPYGDVFNNDFDKLQLHDSSIWTNNFQSDNGYQNYRDTNQNTYYDQNTFIQADRRGPMHPAYGINDISAVGIHNEAPDEYSMMSYDNIHGMIGYDQSYNQNYSMMYQNPMSSPEFSSHSLYPRMRHESGSMSPVKVGYMSPIKSSSCMQMDEMAISSQLYSQKGIKKQYGVSTTSRMLEVIVIPMDPDTPPYPISIKIKGAETSLKQVFTEDYYYWSKIFKGYSPIEPPGYSVFRKALKGDYFQNLTLQILLLKCEGHKFPRNPNAHPFELHCETLFYGPLVVSTNGKEQPYSLNSFTLEDYERLKDLNIQLNRCQPIPLDMLNYK